MQEYHRVASEGFKQQPRFYPFSLEYWADPLLPDRVETWQLRVGYPLALLGFMGFGFRVKGLGRKGGSLNTKKGTQILTWGSRHLGCTFLGPYDKGHPTICGPFSSGALTFVNPRVVIGLPRRLR